MPSRKFFALLSTLFIISLVVLGHSPSGLSNPGSPAKTAPEAVRRKLEAAYGKLPLTFEENRGQTDPHVRFLSRGSGYALFFTSDSALLKLKKNTRQHKQRPA